MRKIEINVSDADYEKVKDLLELLPYVESFRVSAKVVEEVRASESNEGTIRDTVRSEKRQVQPVRIKDIGRGREEERAMAYTKEIYYKKERDAPTTGKERDAPTTGKERDAPTTGSAEPSDIHGDLLESAAEPTETVGSAENTGTPKRKVAAITLMSEESFSEEWDSPEDDRYDEMYRNRDLEDEVQAR